jgi:histidinol-phosphate phosphatase family protein
MRAALFLDRDGTIIEDTGYPRDPALVRLMPGAPAALRVAKDELGLVLVIVSTQSGVARGLVTPEEARAVQGRVVEAFAAEGVRFDGAYFCFHGPDDGCACRKPRPGLLRDAIRELGVDPARSVMIGDKAADVEAGLAAGCRAALAFGGLHAPAAAESFTEWDDVARWLVAHRFFFDAVVA